MKKQHPSIIIVAVVCVIAVGFAAFWEVAVAVCASATVFACYGLFWSLVLLPLLIWRASAMKFVCYGLMVLSLAVLYIVPWNSRKPFLRDFEKVRVGMSVPEVEAIMGGYMKGTGWPALPGADESGGTLTEVGSGVTMDTAIDHNGEIEIKDSITYRHSNEGAFNSDWGVVKFEDGKVVGKRFMPD